MIEPPRQGSPKRSVFDAFQKGGPLAAFVHAADLKIITSRVKRWVKTWGGEDVAEAAKVAAVVSPPRAVRTPRGLALTGKRRVYYKGHKELIGTVTSEGPDQCMVFWPHLGCEKAEVTDWLITFKE